MAAVWQASGTLLGVAGTGADISPVIPTHQTDDILIALTASRDTAQTCLTPSGWTLGTGSPVDSTSWTAYWFWKRATSGAETDPLMDWSAQTVDRYAQVHTVRGADTTGDFFTASAFSGDVTDIIVITGVSTTVANQRVLVLMIANDNASTTVTVTATDPAAFTLHNYQDIVTGTDAEGHAASAIRATAGATGNVSNDFDAAMPAGIGVVLALEDLAVVPQLPMFHTPDRSLYPGPSDA